MTSPRAGPEICQLGVDRADPGEIVQGMCAEVVTASLVDSAVSGGQFMESNSEFSFSVLPKPSE
jgi:hypothetical protein